MVSRSATRPKRDSYLALVRQFPLRPIRSERALDQAIKMIDSLLDQGVLDSGAKDYLEVLGDLVERYEMDNYPMEPVADGELLRHLLDARGVTQAEVAREAGIAESTISEILSGERALSRAHIGKLCRYFHVEPGVFAFGS